MASLTVHGRNLRSLMRDRLPAKVFKRLEDAGRLAEQSGVSAYAVGGLVRDLLLGYDNLDVDIAVEGDGMAFARRLADRQGAGLKIFERFATAYVVFPDGFKLDVATSRGESYAHPTALPVVEPSSLEKDLYRRDFTINTLAIHLNGKRFGELIDFYGGLRDLQRKAIHVLHDRSFVDDPTRLFRAIRFEQRLGFRIETRTLGLLKAAAATDLVHLLSGPRLRNEIMWLLAEKDPRRMVRRMAELDLLHFIHPRLTLTHHVEALLLGVGRAIAWWTKRWPDRLLDRPLVYFMALTEGLSVAAVEKVLARMAFPNRQADKVGMARRRMSRVAQHLARSRALRPSETYRLLAGWPDEGLVLLAAEVPSRKVRHVIATYVSIYQHVKPSLTGQDLKKLGLKPGPLYGKVLGRLLDARLNGEVTSEAGERTLARKLAKL